MQPPRARQRLQTHALAGRREDVDARSLRVDLHRRLGLEQLAKPRGILPRVPVDLAGRGDRCLLQHFEAIQPRSRIDETHRRGQHLHRAAAHLLNEADVGLAVATQDEGAKVRLADIGRLDTVEAQRPAPRPGLSGRALDVDAACAPGDALHLEQWNPRLLTEQRPQRHSPACAVGLDRPDIPPRVTRHAQVGDADLSRPQRNRRSPGDSELFRLPIGEAFTNRRIQQAVADGNVEGICPEQRTRAEFQGLAATNRHGDR